MSKPKPSWWDKQTEGHRRWLGDSMDESDYNKLTPIERRTLKSTYDKEQNGAKRRSNENEASNGPPPKKIKIRDTRADTKIIENSCINLAVDKLLILTPTKQETVRYYCRLGMDEVFNKLVSDPPENELTFNLSLVGHPGAGKSNLVWAVADYLASESKKTVLWVSRRFSKNPWEVKLFEPGDENGNAGRVSTLTGCPKNLSDILKMDMVKDLQVLILNAPIKENDSASGEEGTAAFLWAGGDTRKNNRRVIHVSSLGGFSYKETITQAVSLKEITMRPWTRQDFIEALRCDSALKGQVCGTLGINDQSSVSPEQIVDSKFYYSGINAQWFFNFSVEDIKEKCKNIVKGLSTASIKVGERHDEAVNSAVQDFWVGDRQTKLFTSSYLAFVIGSNQSQQQDFFTSFPLMRDRLGNGSPGEIFECDFAMHLQHTHDSADAQASIMGNMAPVENVLIGTIGGVMLKWSTGRLHSLPKSSSDLTTFQDLGLVYDRLTPRVPLWFVPDDPNQPLIDFFVLFPSENHANKWIFKAIQNTVSPKHTTDVVQLKRLLGGILSAGFMLEDSIEVAFVIEDAEKQCSVAASFEGQTATVDFRKASGARQTSSLISQTFTVSVLRPVFARTGSAPLGSKR